MSDATTPLRRADADAPFPVSGPCERASIAPYCQRVRMMMSEERFAHVLRVAALAETIAIANGFDRSNACA